MNLYKRGNHRPISLLSIFNRIFEKLVYKRLVKFVNKHNILYSSQYGYGSRHSTQHATQGILNDILSNFNKGGSGESTGERALGYRLSPNYFQKFKRMPAPHWAQKMLCIIVPNRQTVASKFFSLVPTRRLLFPSRLIWLMHQRNTRSQETLSLI